MIKYYIQDNQQRFIRRDSDGSHGSYGLTANKSLAEEFKTEEKAFNVLNCCLNAGLRKNCKVVSIEHPDYEVTEVERLSPTTEDIDLNRFYEIKDDMSTVTEDMLTSLNVVNNFIANYSSLNKQLSDELSKLDRKENDIRHYIEFNFNRLSASKAYKVLKLQHSVLDERRKLKNELAIIHTIYSFLNGSLSMSSAISAINSTLNQNYNVRELQELFDGTLLN